MKRVIAVSLLGLLVGCVKSVPEAKGGSEPSAGDFFALTIGAQWTYEIDLLGEKKSNTVKMVRQNRDGYFEDSTGATFLADAYGVRDQKRYLLRNPITVGTSWTNVVSVSSVEHYEITGAGEPCHTRAGQWEGCVTVESKNRIEEGKVLVNRYTLAPRVGIVSLATVLEADGKAIPQARLELVGLALP